jgi:hypothetical protein
MVAECSIGIGDVKQRIDALIMCNGSDDVVLLIEDVP